MAELVAKYQQYAEYKDSGVEWLEKVPSHWNVSPLKLYIDTRKGVAFKSADFTDTGVRVVKASDIKDKTIQQSDVFLPTYFSEIYPKAVLKAEDIVISTVGSTPDVKNSAVGQIGMLPAELNNSLLNQNTVVFSPRKNTLENLFLFYLIQTNVYRDHLDLNAHGTANQASLNVSDMLSFTFALPLFQEQTQIANFLDHETAQIDTLIEKQQILIQLLKEKRQAVISHAVTKGLNPDAPMKDSGVEWLEDVPEHWEVSFVKYIVLGEKDAMVDGPFGSSVNTSEDYVDDGIPVIRTVNITNNGFSSDNLKFMRQQKFEQLKRHSVKPGDVLFSKVGTIGNACLLPSYIPEAILSTTGSCKISIDQNKIEGEYLVLMFHLMNQTLMEMANSNVQPFLNMSNIKNLKISVPSIEEQKNILTYLEEKLEGIDDLIAKSLSFDKLIRERRTALISAAVTGKIDVRGWQAPE